MADNIHVQMLSRGPDDFDMGDSDNSEFARVNRVRLPKSSEEYRQRRERNNAAVKKSRFKSKQKTLETQKRVDQLKDENGLLERRVETLNRELNFMRSIFVPRRDPPQLQQQQQPSIMVQPSTFGSRFENLKKQQSQQSRQD